MQMKHIKKKKNTAAVPCHVCIK